MKHITRFFFVAIAVLSAAACYNKEIGSPDSQDPQSSDLRITANIIQTRVSYSDSWDTGKLNLEWQIGDILFGYIGGDAEATVTLKVTDVEDGTAVLEADSNADLAKLSRAPSGTVVDLIYTGAAPDLNKLESGEYTVDMTTQSPTGKIPACMHARAQIMDKTLDFHFVNDCAIIEIFGITGIKDDSSFIGDSQTLNSIQITNLVLTGKYTLGPDGLTFEGTDDGLVESQSISLGSPWTVTKAGKVCYNGSQESVPVLIAAAPNSVQKDIRVSATTSQKSFEFTYQNKSFASGVCYVIQCKETVASVDDEYFVTVTDAFNRAKQLFVDGETNPTVVLLKDCGIAGRDIDGHSIVGQSSPINVEGYDATFDLDGHVLTFAGDSECFDVAKNSKLVITDSKSKTDNPGMIFSDTVNYYDVDDDDNGCDLVWNRGTLIIKDAVLLHNQNMCAVVNMSGATLTVNGGKLISAHYTAIYSGGGTVNISGGFIESRDKYETISVLDGTVCTISGGVICSRGDCPTIGCRSLSSNISKLTIKWPDGIAPASPSEDSKHEPLIYAAAPSTTENPYYGYSNAPISAYYANQSNTAVVSLQGGYLISNQSSNMKAFYVGNNSSTNTYNLDYTNFGGFYSNKGMFLKSGSTNTTADLSGTNGFLIKAGSPPVRLYATSQSNSGFTMPLINEDSGDLYYMDNKK